MATFMDSNDFQFILFCFLVVTFIFQLFFYLRYYLQPLRHIRQEKQHKIHYTNEQPGVSVIIYANNDSEQLGKHLEAFLTQDYPEFEVIVVNDGSTDETEEILSSFENRYSNLYHTFLAEGARNLSRRKLSLTLGIKAAKYDIVLLSNANCEPAGNQWIRSIVRNFTKQTDIVLGYSFLTKKKGLLESFIRFDLLLGALRLFGFTLLHRAFIGEGSNLAYRKSRFFEQKGFARFMHLNQGDDDLFIHQIATATNTKVELDPQSYMSVDFDSNPSGWRQMKRNSTFTSRFYRSLSKWIYGFESLTGYLFWISALLSLCLWSVNPIFGMITAGIVVLYLVLTGIFWYVLGKKMYSPSFFLFIPVFRLLDPVVHFIFQIDARLNSKRNYTCHL